MSDCSVTFYWLISCIIRTFYQKHWESHMLMFAVLMILSVAAAICVVMVASKFAPTVDGLVKMIMDSIDDWRFRREQDTEVPTPTVQWAHARSHTANLRSNPAEHMARVRNKRPWGW